jgi:hypothetical protein
MGNAQGGPPPNPQGEEKKEDEPKKKVSVALKRNTLIQKSKPMRHLIFLFSWPALEIQPRDGCSRWPETQEEGSSHWREAP